MEHLAPKQDVAFHKMQPFTFLLLLRVVFDSDNTQL